MSWADEQERLTQEARLQAASPEEVYRELKNIAQKPLHFVKNEAVEALLVERNQPLINLALACFGTSEKVYRALYNHSLEPSRDVADATYKHGLRVGCLSNRSVPAANFSIQSPLRLIGQEELYRLIANGDDNELEALLCNPSVCDELLEAHQRAWAEFCEKCSDLDEADTEADHEVLRLSNAVDDTAGSLLDVVPTTIAGVSALLTYAADHACGGNTWPEGYVDENPKTGWDRVHGVSWEVYLHKSLAKALPKIADTTNR
jgi:hypothetical protein